jgi:mono/diheme cytochrome c family protein
MMSLIAGLALTGCVAGEVPAAPSDAPQLVQGRDLYSANCMSCHGADGSGGAGTQLNGGRVLEQFPDVEDQISIVAQGQGTMPGFSGTLSGEEIEAVVAFTREVLADQG